MKEAWAMTSVKAKCYAAAVKCYIAYHWQVYGRKIAIVKSLGAERENKDGKKSRFYSITQKMN